MSPLFVVSDLEQFLDSYTQKLGFEILFRYENFYAGITGDEYSVHMAASPTYVKSVDLLPLSGLSN